MVQLILLSTRTWHADWCFFFGGGRRLVFEVFFWAFWVLFWFFGVFFGVLVALVLVVLVLVAMLNPLR